MFQRFVDKKKKISDIEIGKKTNLSALTVMLLRSIQFKSKDIKIVLNGKKYKGSNILENLI